MRCRRFLRHAASASRTCPGSRPEGGVADADSRAGQEGTAGAFGGTAHRARSATSCSAARRRRRCRNTAIDYPFEQTKDILKQAQIVFGNLEGPLTDAGTAETAKQYVFRSPPDKVAPALARAGFNVVSLANNHTLDYGPEGLEDTRAALDKAGIRHAGAGRNAAEARQPVYMMADGVTVGGFWPIP